MSWLKLLGILHKLAEKIPDSAFPVDLRGKSQSQVLLELEALEAATSATVDAAVRQLSRGNTVLVSATERYFLKLRILSSYPLLLAVNTSWNGALECFVPFPERSSLESALEWLLIDVWNSTSREQWISDVKKTQTAQLSRRLEHRGA